MPVHGEHAADPQGELCEAAPRLGMGCVIQVDAKLAAGSQLLRALLEEPEDVALVRAHDHGLTGAGRGFGFN